jgi:hypothetical protein
MNASIRCVLVISSLALALGAPGFSQSPKTRDGVQGSETIRGYRLSPDGRVVLDPAGQILRQDVETSVQSRAKGGFVCGSDLP